jgi:hypothetical protein
MCLLSLVGRVVVVAAHAVDRIRSLEIVLVATFHDFACITVMLIAPAA